MIDKLAKHLRLNDAERKQLDKLIVVLNNWVKERDKIKSAYIAAVDNWIRFLVVQKGVKFDRDFEEELSDLDIQVAQDKEFDLINLTVLSLPNVPEEAIGSFVGEACFELV